MIDQHYKRQTHFLHPSGFTIIELLVVIVVISILGSVVASRLDGGQVAAKDKERKSDIEAIARHFETYYSNPSSGQSSYPTISSYESAGLTGLDPAASRSPGANPDGPSSLIPAQNNNPLISGVLPQPTISQYVYQPLTSDQQLCEDDDICVKFNIFYRLESTGVVTKLSSKNQ